MDLWHSSLVQFELKHFLCYYVTKKKMFSLEFGEMSQQNFLGGRNFNYYRFCGFLNLCGGNIGLHSIIDEVFDSLSLIFDRLSPTLIFISGS